MIQRIQTIYLLVVTILISLMFFFPIVEFLAGSGEIFMLRFNKIELQGIDQSETLMNVFPLTILLVVIIFVELFAIFSFKKRIRQMRLCSFNIFLFVGLLIMIYFFSRIGIDRTGALAHYNLCVIYPVISIVLNYLAIRAIGKDEALVRSVDRIR